MVTHEPSVAAYAQEVAVLKDGKLVERFPTSERRCRSWRCGTRNAQQLQLSGRALDVQLGLHPAPMVLRKLAISNFDVHKVRVVLTVAAIALSVSLVVAVTSGYASVEAGGAQVHRRSSWGPTDARSPAAATVAQESANRCVGRNRVRPGRAAASMGGSSWNVSLLDNDGKPDPRARRPSVIGIRRPGDKRVESHALPRAAGSTPPTSDVAVIDQVAQEKLKVKVGDTFLLPGIDGKLTLKVDGHRAQARHPRRAGADDLRAAGDAAEVPHAGRSEAASTASRSTCTRRRRRRVRTRAGSRSWPASIRCSSCG